VWSSPFITKSKLDGAFFITFGMGTKKLPIVHLSLLDDVKGLNQTATLFMSFEWDQNQC